MNIIKQLFEIKQNQNYIITIPKHFESKRKYKKFMKSTNKFIKQNITYDRRIEEFRNKNHR